MASSRVLALIVLQLCGFILPTFAVSEHYCCHAGTGSCSSSSTIFVRLFRPGEDLDSVLNNTERDRDEDLLPRVHLNEENHGSGPPSEESHEPADTRPSRAEEHRQQNDTQAQGDCENGEESEGNSAATASQAGSFPMSTRLWFRMHSNEDECDDDEDLQYLDSPADVPDFYQFLIRLAPLNLVVSLGDGRRDCGTLLYRQQRQEITGRFPRQYLRLRNVETGATLQIHLPSLWAVNNDEDVISLCKFIAQAVNVPQIEGQEWWLRVRMIGVSWVPGTG